MTRTRQRLLMFSVAALVGMGMLVDNISASHSWAGFHWARTANPFTLKLGKNLSVGWQTYLANASLDWNSQPAGTTTPVLTAIVAGSTNPRRCAAIAGTTQVCDSTYGNNGWLGLATIYITGGVHITRGTAKMNNTYFNTDAYNNANERQHVMCQEIAHTFGLDHQSVDGTSQNTCMDYSTSPESTQPNALTSKS
ncbi:MAG: hypothetical protein EXQ47_01995 [Bryobacterales bacterium]|nr:hypothetical protein [Bryobacterales bacterium]